MVFVVKWLGLEAPVLFEVVRAAVSFAPTVTEYAYARDRRSTHQLPVHEIVALERSGFRGAATVIRQHLIAEIEAEDARDRPAVFGYREHATVLSKNVFQQA